MRLGRKIFASFSLLLLTLLGITHFITNTRTEAFEVAGITNQLELASDRFRIRLENQRSSTFRLVSAITSGQKYRAFLQQMKENFYSFAEELVIDTGSDHVLILDEDLRLRGVSPSARRGARMEAHVERLSSIASAPHLKKIFDQVLETGKGDNRVVAFGDGLANAAFVPLKESAGDDYALGVILVAERIDDDRVRKLLGNEVDDLSVALFVGARPVASNASDRTRSILVGARGPAGKELTRVRLRDDRHLVSTTLFEGAGVEAGYVVAANLDRSLEPIAAMQRAILVTGGGIVVMGLVIALGIAGGIVRPLKRLVEGTHGVIDGDYSFRVEKPGGDEVGELTIAFGKMVEGLREKETIRNLFGKYVHPSIVSGLLEDPEQVEVGGKRQVQSLLFCDVENFVGISSGMDAEALVGFLNIYLGAMTEELTRSDGILDKYLGDGIMAFFGPPFTPGNHAEAACRAALRMQLRLAELASEWTRQGLPAMRARIGVSTGEVVVGNIGPENIRDYTCIGETVNIASRLESLNKHYGTTIIIDAGTREMVGRSMAVRELDKVRVVGSDLARRVYELVALAGEQSTEASAVNERYRAALVDYRAGRFEQAALRFHTLAESPYRDAPSRVMAARCDKLKESAGEGWDGVYEIAEK